MVNSDHGMQDIVVWVTGPWEAESEDECGPSHLELGLQLSWGTLPTTDVEAKLRRLTAVNYNNLNWS